MKYSNRNPAVSVWNLGMAAAALVLTAGGLTGCGEKPVSFSSEVQPLLQANCSSCHQPGGSGEEASGFSVANYDELMKGTRHGPMVIAGDAEGSNLVVLMEGRADPSISMPHGDIDAVPQQQIDRVRLWIDQGANNN